MNPRERLLAALRGQPVDRVPLVLEGFHFAFRRQIEQHPDPGRREIARRAHDALVYYVDFPSHVNRYLVTPTQCIRTVRQEQGSGIVRTTSQLSTPLGPLTAIVEENAYSDTTWTVRYPVETRRDIEAIRSVAWELPKDLAAPDLTALPLDWQERAILQTKVSSPFVCVAGMMPYQMFLQLCATDLPLIEELTAQCTDRILDVLDHLFAAPGIEYLWMGGCEWLTPPMASPRLYETLVQPYEERIIAKAHQHGAICHIHCHGRVRSTIGLVLARGGDFFEPMEPPPDGDLTMAEGKSLAKGEVTLGGNVEARILVRADADAVEAATRLAFEGGKERMVLQTTAGPLQAMTPRMIQNYHRMLDVWEELSPVA